MNKISSWLAVIFGIIFGLSVSIIRAPLQGNSGRVAAIILLSVFGIGLLVLGKMAEKVKPPPSPPTKEQK